MYRVTLSIGLDEFFTWQTDPALGVDSRVDGGIRQAGERETYIPPITQEAFMEMIGTTRSRVGSS